MYFCYLAFRSDYIEAFDDQISLQKQINDSYCKNLDEGEKLSERNVNPDDYFRYLGEALKLEMHEKNLKNYEESLNTYQKVFEKN